MIDLFGLQDVDEFRPAIFKDTMSPWIKQKIKIIDGIVRTGIFQGAETEAIAKRIGKEIKEDMHALQLNPTNINFNNMNVREFHAGGYTVGPENVHLYLRNLSRTAFRQLAGIT